MKRTTRVRATSLSVFVLGCWATATPARAQGVQQCGQAFERGQTERLGLDYSAAKRDFLFCSQRSCPKAIVSECVQFLSALKQETPSVVFRVTNADGQEIADVDLAVNGTPLAWPGGINEVNPGIHHLRVRAGLYKSLETSLSIEPREREKLVELKLASGMTGTSPCFAITTLSFLRSGGPPAFTIAAISLK